MNQSINFTKHTASNIKIIIFLLLSTSIFCQNKEQYFQLKIELDSIYKMDQLYRTSKAADSLMKLDQPELKKAMEHMDIIDNSNSKRISEIIDIYGWLGTSTIGESGNSTIFAVIQHSDIKTQLKYLPVFKESALKGESSKKHYAFLTDRILMHSGKKQIYGTQTPIDLNSRKYYIHPLLDPDNVNKRRAEMSMEPIEEYIRRRKSKGLNIDDWNLKKLKIEQKNNPDRVTKWKKTINN